LSEEVLINVTPYETRVAIVSDGVLQEIHIERESSRGIVGNLYLGKVVRILPGMQAVFVDIGLQRTAFLHASDIVPDKPSNAGKTKTNKTLPIGQLLHDGQEVLVQILKDPIGDKGARLTTKIRIPSRFLVYMPKEAHVGISQRIEDERERTRLTESVERLLADEGVPGGFILRTASERVADEELLMEIRFLQKVWERAVAYGKEARAPSLIHEDSGLVVRALRDLVSRDVARIRIDSRESMERVVALGSGIIPEAVDCVEYYSDEIPIFDLYSVEEEIERSLGRRIDLKSGGYLVFDQTEAMTTIDVNTGAFTGSRNLEETLFRTNMEASQVVARQIRLRNCGGIIIVDFIDMQEKGHQRKVLQSLEQGVARDSVNTTVTEMSQLGLVEVTRKRTRESIEQLLCEPCSACRGRGVQKTPVTICYQIFRQILREVRQYDAQACRVLASNVVIDLLLDEEAGRLSDLQHSIKRPIHIQAESSFQQEQYDIVLM
jgi:ribonuclease G